MSILSVVLLTRFAHPTPMSDLSAFVLLYVGPDQMLPVVSALGAIFGFLLIVWHRVVALMRRAVRYLTGKKEPDPEPVSRE